MILNHMALALEEIKKEKKGEREEIKDGIEREKEIRKRNIQK